MLLSIVILLLLPYNNTCIIRSNRYKHINSILINILVVVYMVLIYIGYTPVNNIGIIIGKIMSILYYSIIVILIPIIGIIENNIYYYS